MKVPVFVMTLALATSAWAQEQDEPPPDDDLPTLDQLLGLEEAEEKPKDEQVELPDSTERELDRLLSGEEAAETFKEAARLMDEAADRLQDVHDVGIDTQRLQEDILRRLEMLINSAQQQQSQSRSTSKSQQQQQQDQPMQQQQPENQQAGSGDNRAELTPPELQEGKLGPAPALGSALWGALPQRVRDAISQGTSDEFSALYQGLTESYYRRLAEEANR